MAGRGIERVAMAGAVDSNISWAMVRSKALLCLAGLALALASFRLYGFAGMCLDLVHLTTVAAWFTGETYPSIRVLHVRASAISWVVSGLVGACVAGLWAGVYTLNRRCEKCDNALSATGHDTVERA